MVRSGDQGAAMAFFGLYCPYFTFPGVSDDRLFARVAEIAAAAEDAEDGALQRQRSVVERTLGWLNSIAAPLR